MLFSINKVKQMQFDYSREQIKLQKSRRREMKTNDEGAASFVDL